MTDFGDLKIEWWKEICKIWIDPLNSKLDLDTQHLGHLQAFIASDVQ